jgi:cellobiose phosphorylase
MTALLFCHGLREFAGLARHAGDDAIAREAEEIYARLAARINDVCWDGEWYNRGFAPDGRSFGSHRNREGQIFLNPQTWAVISGVADADRIRTIMGHVDGKLENDLGMDLLHPLFSSYDPDIGSTSANAPGIAENGVYIHAGTFKLVADCIAGRPEAAWRLLHKILPNHPDNPVSQSRCTPFAVTNSWRGAEGECYGLTGSQWRTGTAGWVFRAMIEYILGVRRGYDGLIVDPCLPASQAEARIDRVFRGVTYRIRIDNRAGRCTHAQRVVVDGQPIEGNVLPFELGREAYEADVTV